MPTINQLSATDSLSPGDLLPVYSSSNGDARKAAMSVLLSYIEQNISSPLSFVTQHAAPSATGFSVEVEGSENVWLLLIPAAGYAAGTIVLPAVGGAQDGQEVVVNSTQAVTTLTVDGNGAAGVSGAPTALLATGFFRMRYDAITKTWYRIG